MNVVFLAFLPMPSDPDFNLNIFSQYLLDNHHGEHCDTLIAVIVYRTNTLQHHIFYCPVKGQVMYLGSLFVHELYVLVCGYGKC